VLRAIARYLEVTMKLAIAALATALAASGCATESFSYVQGGRYFRTPLDTFDTILVSVDGESSTQRPQRIEPGKRTITVQGLPTAGFRYGEQRTLSLDIKPCVRYWIAARKNSRLSQDFEPYVDYSEPISGCKS
jgi:hypothetical protein